MRRSVLLYGIPKRGNVRRNVLLYGIPKGGM